jgi:hypothetical protein
MFADEDLHRHAVENLDQADGLDCCRYDGFRLRDWNLCRLLARAAVHIDVCESFRLTTGKHLGRFG